MNTKLLAGSILTGLSLIGAILNAWARHFFFTMFYIARGESLEGAGSFDPGPYGVAPESTQIFLGIRLLLWLLVCFGIALLVWGVLEETRSAE
ncbi:hypothetical protein [Haloarcula nitratireducens]|uniref:Uncharacterized protein n=1 Tax=Haloarcula nitratireducens TaxID=2487749 RepID=A0AAW4PLN6_9EURY|nr:hypothetical protein [Halomicroarcula nitratireducens]MBX0298301.1 hypothetical protein [Halomicroarcula nitratireducens]